MGTTGIIVQARSGASRLPDKMLLDFYNGKGILEIILDRLREKCSLPLVLATTTSASDDRIFNLAGRKGIDCFRGSEDNVLDRFIQTATRFGFERIIRVCADNPFLDAEAIGPLMTLLNSENCDYASYQLPDGTPSILTHFGFWAEATTLNALQRISALTDEKSYLEHVTGFMYRNPDLFNCRFLPVPQHLAVRKDLRFTLDTPDDFRILSRIYAEMLTLQLPLSPGQIVSFVENHPEYLSLMKQQIELNKK
ncbi:MAG: cytidylyltransferase domain-containing protein [Bacteroidota bacterium]